MTELNFSGNSVARGVIRSETMSGLAPRLSLTWVTATTKSSAPPMMPAVAMASCRKMRRRCGITGWRWK